MEAPTLFPWLPYLINLKPQLICGFIFIHYIIMVKKNKGKKKYSKEVVTETERKLYNLKLLDFEQKIQRLKNRDEELDIKIDDLKELSTRIDQEKGDIIAAIKRELKRKKDECYELQERKIGLINAIKADEIAFKRECYVLERKFQSTQEQMTGEIKLRSGQLFTLEEFKSKRVELTKKYKKREEEMKNTEIEHQKALKKVEKEFIKARNRLKKTFEEQIFNLSSEFHKITEKRITPTTHRTIRENIAIRTEMESLELVCKTMNEENIELKINLKSNRKTIHLYEEEITCSLAKMAVQNRLVDISIKDHQNIMEKLKAAKEEEKLYVQLDSSFEKTTQLLSKVRHNLGILRQHYEALMIENKDLKHQMNVAIGKWKQQMKVILKTTAYIKHIIHIDDDPKYYKDKWIFEYDDTNFLYNILEILLKATVDQDETESSDYWEPPVELRSSAGRHIPSEDFMSQLSILSEGDILEEGEEEKYVCYSYSETEIKMSLEIDDSIGTIGEYKIF